MTYGCLPAKKDLRDYKIIADNSKNKYPEKFELKNLPRVKNQEDVNSCSAHATSSILEYYNNTMLSTNFIYGLKPDSDTNGMKLVDACKIVYKLGDTLESDCPGNDEFPKCEILAEVAYHNIEVMNKAKEFRIDSYYLCKNDNDIKYALMNFGPCLGSIYWRDNYALTPNKVIIFDKRYSGGYHAVMIYGWNEIGWLVQNSWGNNWGDDGRFILPFSYGFNEVRALVDFDNSDDKNIKIPKNNKFLNVLYKLINKIINLFDR